MRPFHALVPYAMVLCASQASCAGSSANRPESATARPSTASIPSPNSPAGKLAVPSGFQISMRVELHPKLEIGPRDILPDDQLHSRDRFQVVAWATEQVYVYLVSVESSGWSSVAFPLGQHVQIPANRPLSMPGNGALFKVNDQVGDGELMLFASRQPIDEVAAAQLRLQWPLWPTDGTRGGDEKPKKDPPPPPPPPPQSTRSAVHRTGTWTVDSAKHVLSAQSAGSDQAQILFRFKHLP